MSRKIQVLFNTIIRYIVSVRYKKLKEDEFGTVREEGRGVGGVEGCI